MAGEEGIIDKNYARGSITTNTNQISRLESSNTSLALKRDVFISDISPNIVTIKQSHKKALEYYQNKRAWYKFKTFSLMLIFVLPFLLVSVFYYLKLKKKNSPYTIILTATTTAFTILFLQAVLVFLYDILPKEWIERIFRILKEVPFFRYIIYYGSVLLVIGFFGGLVFYIQKRVFSPTKVAIRRLKDKKYPGCSFPLDSEHSFCPDCGLQLKEECSHCGQLKIRYLTHCPNCGNKESQ